MIENRKEVKEEKKNAALKKKRVAAFTITTAAPSLILVKRIYAQTYTRYITY